MREILNGGREAELAHPKVDRFVVVLTERRRRSTALPRQVSASRLKAVSVRWNQFASIARRGHVVTKRELAALLDTLEQHYGSVVLVEPTDPYELIIYTNCGYPPSQDNCLRGFEALKSSIGLSTGALLTASDRLLARALRAGGIVPELRAARLKLIARLVTEDFGGDLGSALDTSKGARKALKRFPTIGDPGVDKILLFCAGFPVAAVPSNCLHVPLRLGVGAERPNYAASYRSVQEELARLLPREANAMKRAYLLFRRHGQEVCRRTVPLCNRCPVAPTCLYFRSHSEFSRDKSDPGHRGKKRRAGAAPRRIR
jgi:endonuclease-3